MSDYETQTQAAWQEENRQAEWADKRADRESLRSGLEHATEGLDARPAVLAVERGDLAVDSVPIDLAGEQNQLVLQVDDLVQPRPE